MGKEGDGVDVFVWGWEGRERGGSWKEGEWN